MPRSIDKRVERFCNASFGPIQKQHTLTTARVFLRTVLARLERPWKRLIQCAAASRFMFDSERVARKRYKWCHHLRPTRTQTAIAMTAALHQASKQDNGSGCRR